MGTPLSKIKAEHKDSTKVVFGGRGKQKLGERDDIDDLAISALRSGNRNLLNLFEQPMPTLEALQKKSTDAKLATLPATNVTVKP